MLIEMLGAKYEGTMGKGTDYVVTASYVLSSFLIPTTESADVFERDNTATLEASVHMRELGRFR